MADDSQNIQKEPVQKEMPRHRDGQRHHHIRREHPQQPEQAKPAGSPEKEPGLDDEETDQDRAVPRPRGHRGGRPEKKVYEEWASDPYCE
jgi:hypothetical protein